MTFQISAGERTLFTGLITVFCTGLSFGNDLTAEEVIKTAKWSAVPLGVGVMAHQAEIQGLFKSNQILSYVIADMNAPGVEIKFPYLSDKRQTTSRMIKEQYPNAVAGINGSYFALYPAKGGHTTYLKAKGEVIPPETKKKPTLRYVEGALVLHEDKRLSEIRKIPSSGWDSLEKNYSDIMANSPLLMKDGSIVGGKFQSFGNHCSSRHPRSAVGITADRKLILMTADGRRKESQGLTCQETAEVMKALGCVEALNLDGGGSTTLYGSGQPFNGVLNYPTDNQKFDHRGERSCANAIAIIAQPLAGKEGGAEAGQNATAQTTGASSAVNSGSAYIIESRSNGKNGNRYRDKGFEDSHIAIKAEGTTPSGGGRVSTDAGAVAEWNPVISAAGKYRVSVTYPALSPSESGMAIYTVNSAAGKQSFEVNQGMQPNTWVPLGVFNFAPNGNGYVQLKGAENSAPGRKIFAGAVKFESVP